MPPGSTTRSDGIALGRLVISAQAGIKVAAKVWLNARFRGHDSLMLKKRETKRRLSH